MNNKIDQENSLTIDKKDINIKKTKISKDRRPRVSLDEQRRLIDVPRDPDYMYRLVNDVDNRIKSFLSAGYELVDRTGKEVEADLRIQDANWRQSAASQHVGQGIIAYVMRIPKKWYEEDRAKAEKKLKQAERSRLVKGISEANTYGDVQINHSKTVLYQPS